MLVAQNQNAWDDLLAMLSDLMCWSGVPEMPFGIANLGKDEEDEEEVSEPDELTRRALPCSLPPLSAVLVPAGSCGMRLLRPPGAGGRAEECPCCGGFPLPPVPCTRCSAGWGQRGIVWGQAGAFGSLLGLRVGFSGAFQLPESRTQK